MRWVFRIVGVFVVAGVAALTAVLFLPAERIARIAAEQVEAQTGRSLNISGDVSVTLWPVLGVRTGPVAFGNADWAGTEPMLSAKSLSIGVSAPGLLRGKIRVSEVAARDPVLRLQSRADGRGNWEFGSNSTTATEGTAPEGADDHLKTPITLDRLDLKNATVVYAAAGEAPVRLSGVDLVLNWPEVAGPADIVATLRPAGTEVQIAAQILDFASFLKGDVVPVSLRAGIKQGAATFDGRVNRSGEAAGHLVLDSSDMTAVLKSMGMADATFPIGWGPAGKLVTDVTYTLDGRVAFRELTADLGANRLSGAVDLVLGTLPKITAQLTAGVLSFPETVTELESGAKAPEKSGNGWSQSPIDASGLGLADAVISLSAQGVNTSDFVLGPVEMKLTVDKSRAVLSLVRVSVFDGLITGRLVANNRKGFSVGGKLRLADIDIQQAQRDLAGFERIQGKAAGELEFLGVGASVESIMRSLSGSGALRMGRGVILGVDLDRLMRNGEGTGGTTVFESLTGSFSLTDGDLINDDLLLTLTNFRADGTGRIGIGAQDIDYLFTPVALRANAGQGLAIPIRIKGPWAAPQIRPDLEAAAKAKADIRLKALEEDAKSKLQQKLEQELDVKVEEGQDPEEVLKDQLENKAKEQLLKLLGKN